MFDQWGEFYLLVGSAAAVLIGLIFVVISLMQDRSRSTVLTGSRLYMGPIVLGVSFVLVQCGGVGPGHRQSAVRSGHRGGRTLGSCPRHHVVHRDRSPQGSPLDGLLVLRRGADRHLPRARRD